MESIVLDHKAHVFEEYNVCPFCHMGMKPVLKTYVTGEKKNDDFTTLTIIWRCPIKRCEKDVVTVYYWASRVNQTYTYYFKEFLNGTPSLPIWPDIINNLKEGNPEVPDDPGIIVEPGFSKFSEVYLQSLIAEQKGLNQIAGMGYRKTVEFLIKDWAIQLKPLDREKIIKMTLANVIANYYFGNLKDILDRTAWLGNDETHYVRIFQNFDINDLKELIRLVITTLSEEDQKQKYIASIAKYGGKTP